jgi:O-antigen ligase
MTIAQTGATDASQAPTSHDHADVWVRVRGGIAFAILLAIFITLNPFSDLGDPKVLELSSGNEAATYVTLFLLVALAALLLQLSGRLPLHLLATRENLLLLAWLVVVSVALSADPGTSARRFVLSFTAFLLAAMLPWLTRGSRHFAGLLLALAALALVLSYIGILVAPHLTIHQATDLGEPEIAGDWRGVFGHKNLAASMMAVFIYVGWFAARSGRPLTGTLVALAAFVFLLMSGGKSALGLVFIVAVIAFFVVCVRSIRARALFAFGPLALLGFLTVGSVASTAAASLLRALPIDVTFTGRTEIWSFALDALRAHPWKGYGFEAFWYSAAAVRFGAEDSTRWMVEVATSHNSYVDLALTIGIPGLALVVLAFVVAPLRDFHRTYAAPENVELSRFFLVLWLFALYLGTFEAFFLSRATPMWFILALATCGLRYTSQLAVKD